MQFAQRLDEIKHNKGLTNVKIAEYAEVSESAVRSWLTNSKIPSATSIVLLCERLNISSDFLLGIKNIEKSEQSEILSLWNKLDPVKQAEFKGELKGYIRAKEENNK
jgi:transcriptional regulator with XRE-family HTH domain